MALATLSIDLVAKLATLERDMGRASHIAEKNAKKMNDAFNGVNSTIKTIAGSVLGYASVSMFTGLIKNAIDAQDELKDLSKSTSISIETLAGLGTAALKSGGELESIAASINKLSVNMGKDAEKFAAIGISAKDPIEAFKQLADVFNAIEDPQKRAAFAAEALGKSWMGAAPLLAEGSNSIGEMVTKGTELSKVTAESAARADELNDMLVDLKTIGGSVTTQFANLLVPSLLDTAKAMEDAAAKGHPLLALLRGFAGLGKIPFDLAIGEIDTSAAGFVSDLEAKLKELQDKKEAYNPFVPWGDSLEEIEQQITVAKNQLEAAAKFKDRLENKAPSVADRGSPNLRQPAPDVDGFINDQKKPTPGGKGSQERVAELTVSTRDYQAAMEALSSALNRAQSETLGLDQAQETLHNLMQSPEWGTYSEAMQWAAIEQASFASGALTAADAQSRLNAMIAATPTAELEKAQKDMTLLAEAFKKGQISAEQFSEAATSRLDLSDEVGKSTEAMSTFAEQAARNMQDAFADFLFDPFKDGADGMLKNFGTTLQKMAAQAIAADLSKKIFGKAGGGEGDGLVGGVFDWFKNIIGNADGGVYNSPSLSAYSGGIYNSPQLFKFASGAGVFAEAGPEAIMPLKRGKDGKLGVSGVGGSGGVTIHSSPVITIDSRTDQGQVQAIVAKAVSAGNAQLIQDLQEAGAI